MLSRNNKILAILLIIAVVIAIYFLARDSKKEQVLRPTLNGTPAGANAIYVPDQPPSKNIYVSVVVLSEPGYIVIHREEGGAPGDVIGVSEYKSTGEHWKISVPLKIDVTQGTKLFAMLHKDNGDLTFSPTDDLPVGIDKREVIMMPFLIDKDAVMPKELVK